MESLPRTKRCARCQQELPRDAEHFPPSKQLRDGFFSYCRACKRLADQADRAKHPDRGRVNSARWYAANRDRALAYSAARWRDRPDLHAAHNEASKRYARRHPEQRADSSRRYYDANRDACMDRVRDWNRRNRDKYLATKRFNQRLRQHRQRASAGRYTLAQLSARWDYYGGRCWMCGGPATTIDHVIAVKRGGSNWPANLRPACASCNSRKNDADWRQFM